MDNKCVDAETLIEMLALQPHPEGGCYRCTYRSEEVLPAEALPERYGGERHTGTAIYYLLTADTFSAFHRVQSDEVFHFYLGDPVSVFELREEGELVHSVLGADLAQGQRPQHVVPRGVWQALTLAQGGEWALLGATVAPGFDFADFELARRDDLLAHHPQHAELIRHLTRDP